MTDAVLVLLWKISWQAALLAGVVWVVTRLARRAPAGWRYALWVVVLAKFLVPPFAYLPEQYAFWHQPVNASAPAAVLGYEPATQNRVPATAVPEPVGPANDYAQARPAVASAGSAPLSVALVFNAAWAAGVCLTLSLLCLRLSRQARLIRRSVRTDGAAEAMLAECAGRVGVKRVPRLRQSQDARTPMLVGLFRPVVLLPQGLAGTWPESQLRAILLHELAHVRRCDMAAVWLYQIVQVVFFFNPMLWLAGRQLKRECELACDELVLSSSGITRHDYAEGYVSALKMASPSARKSVSLAMAEPFEMEKQRLHTILRLPLRKLTPLWIAALVLVCVVAFPTFAGLASEPTPASIAKALRDQEAVAGMLTVEYDYTPKIANKNFTSRFRYIRTPEALRAEEYKGDVLKSVASYDRRSGEYRLLVNNEGIKYPELRTYAELKDSMGLPFRAQEFLETTLYQTIGGPLPDLIARGRVSDSRETIDGHPCIRVDVPSTISDVRRYTVWLDPEIGFNPRRIECDRKSTKANYVTFGDYKEAAPGFWFPQKQTIIMVDEKLSIENSNKVISIRVGENHAKSDLLVQFPMGTKVFSGPGRSFIWRGKRVSPAPMGRFRGRGTIPEPKSAPSTSAEVGPGVTVTLRDSPNMPKSGVKSGDRLRYLLQDTDIADVIGQLFLAGAKGVSMNGLRVTLNSYIHSGTPGMFWVGGHRARPPYVITAVGDPKKLVLGLRSSDGAASSLFSMDMITVRESKRLTVPAGDRSHRRTAAGAGVLVTLQDSPQMSKSETNKEVRERYTLNVWDVRNVIGRLYEAGAKGVSVNGQSITAPDQAGKGIVVLWAGSRPLHPPYLIMAVGEPKKLRQALQPSQGELSILISMNMIKVTEQKDLVIPGDAVTAMVRL